MTVGEPRPGDQPNRPGTDAFLRRLGRLVLSVFFREIEVTGAESFPSSGPVVVVSNHINSLVDGVLVTSFLPRIPRLLAASIIWDNKPLVPLLRAASVIPVFRQQDVGSKSAQNRGSFSKTWELLEAGGIFSLFPEGVSHNSPHMRPVKSGAARITLDAERALGPLGVKLVAVGLTYDAKTVFRSRALVQIGEPIDIPEEASAYKNGTDEDRRAAIKQLTERIETSLAAVTLNFATWEDAQLIGRAADLWAQQAPDLPSEQMLAESFRLRQLFSAGYARIKDHKPAKIADLRTTLSEYDQLLFATGLKDAQVGASYPISGVIGFLLRSIFALIVYLPVSAIGAVMNLLPIQASRLIARGKDLDKMASWAIFSSVILMPVCWLIEGVAIGTVIALWFGLKWGWISFLSILVAAPLAGWAALKLRDVRQRLFQEARAWFVLKTQKNLATMLAEQRKQALSQLAEIIEIHDTELL